MTHPDVSFADALTLEGDAGSYRGSLSADWAQGRAAFGGLIGALLLRALQRELPSGRRARSSLVDFVAPVAPGAFEIEARALRSGRVLTHAEARLTQNGAVCATMTAVFGVASSSAVLIAGPAAPELSAPDSLPRLPYLEGVMPRFAKHFDFRYASALPFSGQGDGTIRGYMRHDEPVALDEASLLALIDTWPTPALAMLTRPAPAASVTWMVDFLAELPLAGEPDPGAFVQYEARTVHARAGYASVESRVWARDGTLLAASRQLTLEFS